MSDGTKKFEVTELPQWDRNSIYKILIGVIVFIVMFVASFVLVLPLTDILPDNAFFNTLVPWVVVGSTFFFGIIFGSKINRKLFRPKKPAQITLSDDLIVLKTGDQSLSFKNSGLSNLDRRSFGFDVETELGVINIPENVNPTKKSIVRAELSKNEIDQVLCWFLEVHEGKLFLVAGLNTFRDQPVDRKRILYSGNRLE